MFDVICLVFSAPHGLELDERKRWTGAISDGKVRVRFGFITERALNVDEAIALTNIAKVKIPQLDPAASRQVQPNYIRRPHWIEHPERDPLGDIPTIGWVKGNKDFLAVPDDLTHRARWARAQGHNVDIAEHPDAEAAVRGIGSDGVVRSHLMSAVIHLLNANPVPEVVSFADHAIAIAAQLQNMVELHHAEIESNLRQHGRYWSDVVHYLPDNMIDWAHWLLDHPAALKRKTIKLIKEARAAANATANREAIYARVAHTIARARKGEAPDSDMLPPVELLVAPTGSRKSTQMRANAVRFVAEHPDQSVVIAMPRHKLGDEQIELLKQEHRNGNFRAAVWRGRQAWDPEIGDGKQVKMCQRAEEAEEVEMALLSVDRHLCKQGRGKKAIRCPLFDVCGYQRQKQIEANVWFVAHECIVHKKPKALGDIGWLMIDESPLDAFIFGVDINDQVTLELDALHSPPPLSFVGDDKLRRGREALHCALSALQVPIDRYQGVPASRQSLSAFIKKKYVISIAGRSRKVIRIARHDASYLQRLEWRGKVVPKIKPNMTAKKVREQLAQASYNSIVKKCTTLWRLIEQADDSRDELFGRIQLHRGNEGRVIRMVGLHAVAKGWNAPTLICDATGDAELLRAIWPQLVEHDPHGWQQLPRSDSVRIFQVVDRSISKWAVAVEGKNDKELGRKAAAARRMYAALLLKALQYGGAKVAAIVYKSTETWIRENCHVPDWLQLRHHGDVTGTNDFKDVAALFVVGRPLAAAEDVTRQTEALFGAFIAERDYKEAKGNGRIPIVPDAEGNNTIRVNGWRHRHPMAERMKRQICEAALIQAAGRARAGLRGKDNPLDIYLWTDVALPELGPVEPVLWNELDAGPDGLMLATGGVWLECIPDAVKVYPGGLLTADGLKSARKRGGGVSLLRDTISKTPAPREIRYQRAGAGNRPARAITLLDPAATRAWLEEKLGPLARFDVVEKAIRQRSA